MQKAWSHAQATSQTVRVHVDGGANRSLTSDRNQLIHFKNIKKYPMAGVSSDGPALICTGVGYLPWQADNGELVLVKCYYSDSAADTIISPTDIVVNNISNFEGWGQYSNIDLGKGYVEFYRRGNNTDTLRFTLTASNGLWFYNNNISTDDYDNWNSYATTGKPTVQRLSQAGCYVLGHERYAHSGERVCTTVHLHVDDQPPLRKPPLFKCLTCMMTAGDERATSEHQHVPIPQDIRDWLDDPASNDDQNCLLIMDRKTRYLWIFLTKTKKPPLDILNKFLKEHGHPTAHNRTIRSDKGGELWGSQEFRKTICDHGYILDPTAPGAPFQNGKAERPNRTFGKMVRSLLYSAGLGPEYWSFALLHAAYIKNRIPHRATNQVPFTMYTGTRPSAKRLRVFGCPVIVRHIGPRKAKLDLNTTVGIFLGYTATDKNVVYMDSVTKRFKTATHVIFDEAGHTLPVAQLTPSAKALQKFGYKSPTDNSDDENLAGNDNEITANAIATDAAPNMSLQVKYLSINATMPSRATDGSAGYDLYSAVDITIQPKTRAFVPLDITIVPPIGTYGQILSRSGLAAQHYMDVKAGTIDSDYTGNIQVLLENNSEKPFTIEIGDRIAQMVLYNIQTPQVIQTATVQHTTRGTNGFGSTGFSSTNNLTPPQGLPIHDPCIRTNVAIDETTIEKPFDLYFSHDPFDNNLEIDIPIKGDHPTLGVLSQYCPYRQRLQIKDMALSSPGSRLPKWRSTLRNAYILKIQEFPIFNAEDMEHAVRQLRLRKIIKAKLVIATDRSYGVHPIEGIMQIYFDQMNVIAKHLEEVAEDRRAEAISNDATIRMVHEPVTVEHISPLPPEEPPPPAPNIPDVAQAFTKKQIMQRDDWTEWEDGQFKQLDMYWNQGMFSNPLPLPKNSNALRMLWRFNLKACGTKKSRMVCNGSPNQKGTVTLGHTYANALDAASERLFWAIVANEGLIAIGADVSNAFAEAPAPKAPLFLYIDDTFREWWVRHLGKDPIPLECNAVRVHNAIQGHPESPRLWEKHIDKILQDLGLKPTTHEPCLYSGEIHGKRILFLRQVDDFAVASTHRQDAEQLIDSINDKMRIHVKQLGIIDRFNGMDIFQTRHYVKITCSKYLQKVIKNHRELLTNPNNIQPLPLYADSTFLKQLEQTPVPNTIAEKSQLKQRMGFNYRQIIGEVIFPMMKCRPEIAAAGIKLSQYMENPAELHYKAVLGILDFLSQTIDDGIYYWRRQPRDDLPEAPLPTIHPDNYYFDDNTPLTEHDLYGYVDSDWGSDSVHRKSITGVVLIFAGGAVGYRCKYQDVIAHSSTEAEFTAACDAGKMILFFRSLLDDLGIEQKHATVLYEDNNGALMMANAQQPTRRTRHMDIKKFALLDWVEQDLMILQSVKTAENAADGMTKPLGRQLFYRHADTIMGRRVPQYVLRSNSSMKG
mmetsp:Transcript_10383/g.14952  ORF Transcript_10383/g.14952 Transcript_10383/m.14952 type:complete len:1434 (-) Transcript_10383:2326-6627(-)